MCPVCIGTAMWLLSGSGAVGGLAATLKLRSARRVRSARKQPGIQGPEPDAQTQETAGCGAAGLGATASPMTHPT
jgi:hypothetical protein